MTIEGHCLNTIDSVPLFFFVFGRFDVIMLYTYPFYRKAKSRKILVGAIALPLGCTT